MDMVPPKWVLSTKRGWGMLITFVSTMLPVVSVWLAAKGINIEPGMVTQLGEAVGNLIEQVGVVVGLVLWVWGSFRPTAPITMVPPEAAK